MKTNTTFQLFKLVLSLFLLELVTLIITIPIILIFMQRGIKLLLFPFIYIIPHKLFLSTFTVIHIILTPVSLLYSISIHYVILSNWKLFIYQDDNFAVAIKILFIFVVILTFYSVFPITTINLQLSVYFLEIIRSSNVFPSVKISLNYITLIEQASYTLITLISLFSFSIASFKVVLDISRFYSGTVNPKPTILFLRKFQTKGDHILPTILALSLCENFNIKALSSKYLRRSLSMLTGNINIIPLWKRIFHPFSYTIDYRFTSDNEWLQEVKILIQDAYYIVIDISNISENIEQELDLIIKSQRGEDTYFLSFNYNCKNKKFNHELLQKYNLNIENKYLPIEYSFFFFSRNKVIKKLRNLLPLRETYYEKDRILRELKDSIETNIYPKFVEKQNQNLMSKFEVNQKIIKEKLNFDAITNQLKDICVHSSKKSSILMIAKIIFIMTYYNIKSEKEFQLNLPIKIEWLCFLGLDFDSRLPRARIVSKFKRILGEFNFKKIYQIVIQHSYRNGVLIEEDNILIGSTSIETQSSNELSQTLLEKNYKDFIERLEIK